MAKAARILALPAGSVLVQLSGELDLADQSCLSDQFACALRVSPDVVVDLRAVSFIDAAAIGILVRARQRAVAEGGSLVLAGATPWVEKVLRLARATPLLPVLPDLRQALNADEHAEARRSR